MASGTTFERRAYPRGTTFPFRKLDDPSHFAKVLKEVSGKEAWCRCVAESDEVASTGWLNTTINTYE